MADLDVVIEIEELSPIEVIVVEDTTDLVEIDIAEIAEAVEEQEEDTRTWWEKAGWDYEPAVGFCGFPCDYGCPRCSECYDGNDEI